MCIDILHNEMSDGNCHCSGNHSHDINYNNIRDDISKLKRVQNDGYDGLLKLKESNMNYFFLGGEFYSIFQNSSA